MGSTASGNSGVAGAWRVSTDQEFDPQFGWLTIENWEGLKPVIISLRNAWAAAGWKSQITHQGPTWRVRVRIGLYQGFTEAAVDQWTYDDEPYQMPIWAHPDFWADMQAYSGGPAGFKKDIEEAIREGLPLSGALAANQTAICIHQLLSRGGEAFESKRPVLTRTRTYSLAFTQRRQMVLVENVYTTSRLVTEFAIPTPVANLIPANPAGAPPAGTAWAWKERALRGDIIPALGKIQETSQWTFAAWSVKGAGTQGLYNLLQ